MFETDEDVTESQQSPQNISFDVVIQFLSLLKH